MVIIDTSVWIEAFRHQDCAERGEVDDLLAKNQVVMAGPVLAEVLQGARTEAERLRLEVTLQALPFIEADRGDWAKAGELSFGLRRQGRTIPLTDLLVAVLAIENGHTIYALDRHFQSIPGVKLHEPGAA